MVFVADSGVPGVTPVSRLESGDVAEMMALVKTTKPGPFEKRTHELGRFVGAKVNRRTVAMAGERMCLDGYTEVSGVCVHPSHRGRGSAADLVIDVTKGIFQQRQTPFLHVFGNNAPAIALYRSLGFVYRQNMHLALLQRQADA